MASHVGSVSFTLGSSREGGGVGIGGSDERVKASSAARNTSLYFWVTWRPAKVSGLPVTITYCT